ncbi:LPXTG cell wall anchor domain-containing protein [Polymorphospora sp. NPDC050346]|uniref:LPXTG cell wall anchor domain-containing protein n=1 Tax=Polymorphospora sp. NPDC050346 TaxID=3155780 RepID=UPI0033C8725D
MPRNASTPSRVRTARLFGATAIAVGVAVAVAVPVLVGPAVAAPVGTITLDPTAGQVATAPFADFTASGPCPTGYGTAADLFLRNDEVTPFSLVSVPGPGLDQAPVSGTVDGSLTDLAQAGGVLDLPDGAYVLELICYDDEFNFSPDTLEARIRVTGDGWEVVTGEPTATPSASASPTPSQSPTGSPSPTPTPTGSPTPTPTDDPTPTPTPTEDPTPTPTGTPPPGSLPKTGIGLGGFLYVAALLVAGGAAAVLWARRQQLAAAPPRP